MKSPRMQAFEDWFSRRRLPESYRDDLHLAFDAGWDSRGDEDDRPVLQAATDAILAYKSSRDRDLMREAYWALDCQINPFKWLFDKIIRSIGP
jgi:hypothetical protein